LTFSKARSLVGELSDFGKDPEEKLLAPLSLREREALRAISGPKKRSRGF
jgi:hypothetical protein